MQNDKAIYITLKRKPIRLKVKGARQDIMNELGRMGLSMSALIAKGTAEVRWWSSSTVPIIYCFTGLYKDTFG